MSTCHSPELESVKLNGFLRSIKQMELEQEHAESLKKKMFKNRAECAA